MIRTDGGYGVLGMPGNHAGVKDLVYRGEPVQLAPMPYYGGGLNIQQLTQNIPVGEDPLLPMDQDQFSDWVRYNLDKKYGPLKSRPSFSPGPQLPSFLNRGVKGAYLPTGFDAKYVS